MDNRAAARNNKQAHRMAGVAYSPEAARKEGLTEAYMGVLNLIQGWDWGRWTFYL